GEDQGSGGSLMDGERQETPLALKLRAELERAGPISVEAYMRACLHDTEHGYYREARAIGATGDFTTAPEISQVFGELIGIWAAVAWRAMGAPRHLDLVELGPGRGTLMRDTLRAARIVPWLLEAAQVTLVESNVTLRQVQSETLKDVPVPIRWHPQLEAGAMPAPSATIVIANEFLDIIPVRQLIFTQGVWRERCIGLDKQGELR